uniref:Uncharacterized protein n=1 Tax=Anguilla anguilla TaxID=7936 RepID=A0A0E9QRE0_ANGAN
MMFQTVEFDKPKVWPRSLTVFSYLSAS